MPTNISGAVEADRDLPSYDHHWMPFTPNRVFKAAPRMFVRGEGMHIKMTGDAGIFAPSLVVERRHIDELCTKLREVLEAL